MTRSVEPGLRSQNAKRRQLAITKRRATALLGAVALVFLAATVGSEHGGWVGYVQATAEASLVGGLADWFAVTALFRRPLGLPIPHTAIVVERKEQFGQTLGEFVQDSFLTPDTIVERIKAAAVVPRLAAWLVDRENADRVAMYVAEGAVSVADAVHDEDVHRTVETLVRERLQAAPLAPMVGRALRVLTEQGRHEKALDGALRGLDRYLDEHREELHDRLAQSSPWWLPGAVEDRIFERVIDGTRSVLQDMAGDREHHLRREIDQRLAQLVVDLEHSPELLARGEELKAELLSDEQLARSISRLWEDAKTALRYQATLPDSELRRRLANAVTAIGRSLGDDPLLSERAERGVEELVRYAAGHFHGEIASLVSATIARWDAEETSLRLELLLGPDLQYIRINGTIVGGLAGLALHGLTQILR